jgi:hypothetical protein
MNPRLLEQLQLLWLSGSVSNWLIAAEFTSDTLTNKSAVFVQMGDCCNELCYARYTMMFCYETSTVDNTANHLQSYFNLSWSCKDIF